MRYCPCAKLNPLILSNVRSSSYEQTVNFSATLSISATVGLCPMLPAGTPSLQFKSLASSATLGRARARFLVRAAAGIPSFLVQKDPREGLAGSGEPSEFGERLVPDAGGKVRLVEGDSVRLRSANRRLIGAVAAAASSAVLGSVPNDMLSARDAEIVGC